MDKTAGVLECAVCLQTCIHPAQLPCGHIFCFLCVKGVANQSKRCAMCRQEIPCDFLENPKLVTASDEQHPPEESEEEGFQWFYEGRNGWWKYDIRTNKELDEAFQSGVRSCELLIAGFLYIIDFDSMLQLRRNDPSRRRRIKRDSVAIPVKGIAGIKSVLEGRVKTPENEPADEVTLVPPSNTPASLSHSGTTTPNLSETLNRTIQQICSLSLQDVVGLVAESRNASETNHTEESPNRDEGGHMLRCRPRSAVQSRNVAAGQTRQKSVTSTCRDTA